MVVVVTPDADVTMVGTIVVFWWWLLSLMMSLTLRSRFDGRCWYS